MRFRNILCPIDFSRTSMHALQHASILAEEYGAKLHLVNVFQLTIVDTDPRVGAYPVPLGLENVRQRLDELDSSATVEQHRKLLIGDPAAQILKYAKQHDIDLIVMGTHGHTGLEHLLMGSVAEYTVRHAHCPVVTIRTPGEAPNYAPSKLATTA